MLLNTVNCQKRLPPATRTPIRLDWTILVSTDWFNASSVRDISLAAPPRPLLPACLRRAKGGKWRTMLGISIVPPFIILSSLCLLPESPRWLLGKGREPEALAVLCSVR